MLTSITSDTRCLIVPGLKVQLFEEVVSSNAPSSYDIMIKNAGLSFLHSDLVFVLQNGYIMT